MRRRKLTKVEAALMLNIVKGSLEDPSLFSTNGHGFYTCVALSMGGARHLVSRYEYFLQLNEPQSSAFAPGNSPESFLFLYSKVYSKADQFDIRLLMLLLFRHVGMTEGV